MNLDTLDKSFLRLVTDFSVAKSELMDSSQRVHKDVIVISPTNKFLQTSNSPTSIAFDDSYRVELVSCSDDVMLDITDKIYINEFQDINGIYQLSFEIAPIGVDYYFRRLFLRFTHLDSDLKLWSNPFILTDNIQKIRLDFKNYSYYQGTDYSRANYYQSIEIAGYFNLPNSKENTKISTLINGDIRRSRPTQAIEYTYNIEEIDTFTFDRLMTTLNSELVYINGVRFIASENVQSDERQGMSNQFATTFKGQFVAKDTYTASYQIAPPFLLVGFNPTGLYTSYSGTATGTLSNNITSISNFKLWNYDTDALIEDLNPTILVNLKSFDAPLSALGLGNYYFTFDAVSYLGQVLNITDKESWKFSIQLGDYDIADYDPTDYFTTI